MAAPCAAHRITKRTDIHTHQLELGTHVEASEGRGFGFFGDCIDRDRRHVVARSDQAVDELLVDRAFADGENMRIAGDAAVVDVDATALAHRQAGGFAEFIARTDAGTEHDHVRLQFRLVSEGHLLDAAISSFHNLGSVLVEVDFHAHRLDLALESHPAAIIDLDSHLPRSEFDDVGFQSHVLQGARTFEAQQTTADHHADLRRRGMIFHPDQVLDGAVDKAAGGIAPRYRRHKRKRSGGHHQLVVRDHRTLGAGDRLGGLVDAHDFVAEVHRDAVFSVILENVVELVNPSDRLFSSIFRCLSCPPIWCP